MEDIPQPSEDPYEPGDVVEVYVGENDLDAEEYHGLRCEVVEDVPDDFDGLTGRELDQHHYRLRRLDTGDELPLHFRHHDLVPETDQ